MQQKNCVNFVNVQLKIDGINWMSQFFLIVLHNSNGMCEDEQYKFDRNNSLLIRMNNF